ncbi:toll-like receptor 13 [Mytilus trossulus]|uniref:toll-like receptor 13 n=1 Tax=Mytilus trossulus TaxID=6551 RepID=UPI0030057A03
MKLFCLRVNSTQNKVRAEKSNVPCLKGFCICKWKQKSAKCSGLDYIPRIPNYVENLKLKKNRLSHISMDIFQNISNNRITSLTFVDNSIKMLTSDAFYNMKYLKHLEISQEKKLNISYLKLSFKSLDKHVMENMNFINNGWTMLPMDLFSGFRNYTLKILQFNDNTFTTFNGSLLSEFLEIHKLYVERNELVFLNASGLHSVIELILTANNMFEIPNFCAENAGRSLVPKFSRLDMTDNAIRKLHPRSFKCLHNLTQLTLDKNRLVVLENRIVSSLTNLESLSISSIPHLSVIKPGAFNCSSLQSLRFVHNGFRFDKEKNNNGKHLFNPIELFVNTQSLMELDLTNNYMPKDPGIFRQMLYPLSNLTKLILQATHIALLPDELFQEMPFLETLNLKGNRITSWNQSVFENLKPLRKLYLDGNHIRVINETSFPIQLLHSLKELDVSHNEFWCTCAQKCFEYDAFVIYCDSDRKWVHSELLKRLEEIDLKVCVHYRDFDVGESITDNITNYVGKSWKVIVVMSNNFTKSEWCQWELDLVQERRRRHGKEALILIMQSEIDSSHMTNSIRSLLDTTPHLQYQQGLGEDLFWSVIMKAVMKPFKDPPTAIL